MFQFDCKLELWLTIIYLQKMMFPNSDCAILPRRLYAHYHVNGWHVFEVCTALILTLVISGIATSKCTSSDIYKYPITTWKHTKSPTVTKRNVHPKSCAAACMELEWCLGVTDNEKTNMCSFHAGDAEDKCSFLKSAEAHQTLYMKGKDDNRDGVSVCYSYIPNLSNPCCISIPNTSLDSIN